MAVYSQADMDRMRQDYIRRSQEMQRRSRSYTSQRYTNQSPKQNNQNTPTSVNQTRYGDYPERKDGREKTENNNEPSLQQPMNHTPVPIHKQSGNFQKHINTSNLLSGVVNNLLPDIGSKIDSEALIIIALIIILAREGADMKLLIALAYLLI